MLTRSQRILKRLAPETAPLLTRVLARARRRAGWRKLRGRRRAAELAQKAQYMRAWREQHEHNKTRSGPGLGHITA